MKLNNYNNGNMQYLGLHSTLGRPH